MSGNPANIGGAPINIRFGLEIKDDAMGKSCLSEISAGCVRNTFGFCSSS